MAKNFSQFTSETTPALSDHAVGYRTAASGGERRTLWSAVYALFKTSFDAVYAAVSHTHAQSEVTNLVSDLGAKAAASDLTSHTGNTSNPHSVTKAQVGLTNVDDTSDAAKPVSTATQTAMDLKAATADVLEKTNTDAFTPTTDYHPATKKYIDDQVIASGSGDVVGPASAVDSRLAAFDGTTGKLIKDGGQTVANILARANHTGTQPASSISDFDTEVGNNSAVTANTAKTSFPEAPSDGSQYARKDAAWAVVAGVGITVVTAPVANNSTGAVGEIAYDGFYKYTVVATNTWVRSIIETTWS